MSVSKEDLLREIKLELRRTDLSRRQRATLELAYENAVRGIEGLKLSLAGLTPPPSFPRKMLPSDTV